MTAEDQTVFGTLHLTDLHAHALQQTQLNMALHTKAGLLFHTSTFACIVSMTPVGNTYFASAAVAFDALLIEVECNELSDPRCWQPLCAATTRQRTSIGSGCCIDAVMVDRINLQSVSTLWLQLLMLDRSHHTISVNTTRAKALVSEV